MAPQNRRQPVKNKRRNNTGFYIAIGFLSLALIFVLVIFIQVLMKPADSPTPGILSQITMPQVSGEPPPQDNTGEDPAAAPDDDYVPEIPDIPDMPDVMAISVFGDDYYYHGATDSAPPASAFNMSDIEGWAKASMPAGYGSRGGVRLNGTYDNSIDILTEIQPGPSPTERGSDGLHAWTFFKKEFELPQGIEDAIADMDIFGEHKVDDALIIYINGIEIYRYNTGQSGGDNVAVGQQVDWSSYQGYNSDPTARPFTINADYDNRLISYPSTTFITCTFYEPEGAYTSSIQRILRDAANRTNFSEAVQSGTNVLTAAVGQNNDTQPADLYFDLQLVIEKRPEPAELTIINPYDGVDWNRHGQYKAALHAHSANSDGTAPARSMVLTHYNKGYDILALTDHNYLTRDWRTMRNPLSESEDTDIRAGTYSGSFPDAGTDVSWAVGASRKTGMISLPNTNEQSNVNHINTYFADFSNSAGSTMSGILKQAGEKGGISHINHPGRYTGSSSMDLAEGMQVSHKAEHIDNKYVPLLTEHESCMGVEIYSRLDYTSLSDRIVWDNILIKTMPERLVWGFANDDAHSIGEAGYNFNILLMPELTADAAKASMKAGAFYAVARVDRREEINIFNDSQGGSYLGTAIGNSSTQYMLGQPVPVITDIAVSGSTITITGKDYGVIEWISDGVKIHTEKRTDAGNSIDLNAHRKRLGSYVRAHIKSETGIACTQPFGIIIKEISG